MLTAIGALTTTLIYRYLFAGGPIYNPLLYMFLLVATGICILDWNDMLFFVSWKIPQSPTRIMCAMSIFTDLNIFQGAMFPFFTFGELKSGLTALPPSHGL